jgi:hypothetical protein
MRFSAISGCLVSPALPMHRLSHSNKDASEIGFKEIVIGSTRPRRISFKPTRSAFGERSPARPALTPSIRFFIHRLARLLHASVRPRPAAVALALSHPPSGRAEDLHLQVTEHAQDTAKRLARRTLPMQKSALHSGMKRTAQRVAANRRTNWARFAGGDTGRGDRAAARRG